MIYGYIVRTNNGLINMILEQFFKTHWQITIVKLFKNPSKIRVNANDSKFIKSN